MHKELIIAAFEKAKKELKGIGVKDPSNHQAAIHISDFMVDEIDFSISKKSIASYYKSALEIPESEDINMSQIRVVQGLCQYLGYEAYKDFILNLKSSDREQSDNAVANKIEKPVKKSKRNIVVVISIIAVLIVGVFIFMTLNKERWMIWNDDHYEEVDFNKIESTGGTLKLLKAERIENFKKINNPDCNYQFFNEDGSVNVWYGKNKNGELEIFTDIGLHPETGKSLKPITDYMIRKYLCVSY